MTDNLHYNYSAIIYIKFEWDSKKSSANIKKHGISFDEAQSFFLDEQVRIIADPDNSSDEERFIILGLSSKTNLLVVCHCYRDNENIIR